MRREKDGKKIFKCWAYGEFGHYASKCPKREKRYKGKFNPRRDSDRSCLYANNLMRKVKVKVMMNWDLWLSRKMILIEKLEKKEL